MQLKGKMYLKVIGILFIIGAVFSIIGAFALFAGGTALKVSGVDGADTIAFITGIILLAEGVLRMAAGVMGVKHCNDSEKAGTLFKLGIAVIVFAVAANILDFVIAGQVKGTEIVSCLISLILPILFVYGAKLNQEA